jgi:hypothetical protein
METTETTETTTPAPKQPAAITPASTWAKRGQALYELPGSGNIAELRRPSLIALAAAGAVPNPLSQDVLRYLAQRDNGKLISPEQQIAEYKRNAKAFIEIAARCFVQPRLITDRQPDYEAGEIGPEDLADSDYTFLFFQYVTEGELASARFRVS